ncbi:MAG: hypothetical protein ABI135_02110 [Rhodoferax sp.]
MPFVLDNSVATGWYIPDQATAYTQAVATRLETDRAIVPALWQLEFAKCAQNGVHQGETVMRHGLPIASQDGKLRDAALQAGVTLL